MVGDHGHFSDSRIVLCCFPGVRIKDTADRMQKPLGHKGKQPEVWSISVSITGDKINDVLHTFFKELGRD